MQATVLPIPQCFQCSLVKSCSFSPSVSSFLHHDFYFFLLSPLGGAFVCPWIVHPSKCIETASAGDAKKRWTALPNGNISEAEPWGNGEAIIDQQRVQIAAFSYRQDRFGFTTPKTYHAKKRRGSFCESDTANLNTAESAMNSRYIFSLIPVYVCPCAICGTELGARVANMRRRKFGVLASDPSIVYSD